jgi:uncharacterized protein YbjT (DUF2867 family)
MYEAGQSGREARMQEDLRDLEERLAEARRAYGQLREQVDLGNRDFTERDVQDKADQIKQLEVQISAYKKAPEAQRGATEETSKIADEVKKSAEADIERAVLAHVDLRPAAIIEKFDLRRPIYCDLAAYGHMGREDLNAPWEARDLADVLKAELL